MVSQQRHEQNDEYNWHRIAEQQASVANVNTPCRFCSSYVRLSGIQTMRRAFDEVAVEERSDASRLSTLLYQRQRAGAATFWLATSPRLRAAASCYFVATSPIARYAAIEHASRCFADDELHWDTRHDGRFRDTGTAFLAKSKVI